MASAPGAQSEGAGPSTAGFPSSSHLDPEPSIALLNAPSSAPSSASLSPEYFTHAEGRFGRPPGGPMPQLSGPGIPGPSTEPIILGPPPRGRSSAPRSRRGSVRSSSSRYPEPYPRASGSSETLDSHRLTPRPARSLPPASMPLRVEDDFPITLPPLMLSRSPSPESHMAAGPSTSTRRRRVRSPLTQQSPIAHMPPPFTLQPPPLWDDPAFSPFNPPGPSSRPGSSYRPSSSHSLSLSQGSLASPTHYNPGLSTTSPTALPSLTNLFHEGVAGPPHSDVTLAPIRTHLDVVRQAPSPRETTLPQSSPSALFPPPRQGAMDTQPQAGPSRLRDSDEPEERRDVHQPPPR